MNKPYIKVHGNLPPGPEARLGRLKQSIQALAAKPDDQLAVFPTFVLKVYELALDFDHWFMVCAEWLTTEQHARLDRIRDVFDQMSGGERIGSDQDMTDKTGRRVSLMSANALARRRGPWSEHELRTDERWQQVRQLAAEALDSFGWPLDRPPKTSTVFVEFDR